MSAPAPQRPGRTLILPPRYLASTAYYAAMAAYDTVVIDDTMPYDKRAKDVHRCTIADTHGITRLTVPVGKPQVSHSRWNDIPVSSHGSWWHVHFTTLESAYGRTPFFEFYKDSFQDLYTRQSIDLPVTEFDARLDERLRGLLGITAKVIHSSDTMTLDPALTDDCRRREPDFIRCVPYYQVRAAQFGFIPGLSAVDLLFNMGPEAPLVLRSMYQDSSVSPAL